MSPWRKKHSRFQFVSMRNKQPTWILEGRENKKRKLNEIESWRERERETKREKYRDGQKDS